MSSSYDLIYKAEPLRGAVSWLSIMRPDVAKLPQVGTHLLGVGPYHLHAWHGPGSLDNLTGHSVSSVN